jgi:hypothetical protein
MVAEVGSGEVLFGELFAVEEDGATDVGLDHPAVEGAGVAVSFVVTRREWDVVGVATGRADSGMSIQLWGRISIERMHLPTAALAFAEDDVDEALAEAAWAVFSRNFLLTLTALNFFG